jgi:probable rRNA maturation factor
LSLSVRGVRVPPSLLKELGRRLRLAMRAARVRRAVSLSLVGDVEIRALNRRFADEDHATDVLSFEQDGPLLGDIVISLPTARRQARAGGRALVDELAHLAVHGLTHLLGYDHATPRQERVMFAYEARLREPFMARGRGSPPATGGARRARPRRGR